MESRVASAGVSLSVLFRCLQAYSFGCLDAWLETAAAVGTSGAGMTFPSSLPLCPHLTDEGDACRPTPLLCMSCVCVRVYSEVCAVWLLLSSQCLDYQKGELR